MAKLKDLTGKKFGRLTVIERAENHKRNGTQWLCRCDCGNERVFRNSNLLAGNCNSCGCLQREKAARKHTTHGRRNTKMYNIWVNMKQRCYNPHNSAYKNYGGRGITVCDHWKNSFQNFLDDMGCRPSADFSLDRIDNNGNYGPSNCRWATRREQGGNTRVNHRLKFYNSDFTISEWSRILNIGKETLRKRIKAGWSVRKTLTTPTRRQVA